MGEFRMPSLGADMDSGVLLEWRVKPGDHVHRGDIVAVVDTSKAEIEIEVFEDGLVEELVTPVGERVPVGAVIARIRSEAAAPAVAPPSRDGAAPAEALTAPAAVVPPAQPTPGGPAPLPPEPPSPAPPPLGAPAPARRRVTPIARRTAELLGVDLAAVEGTGPRGAVTKADVERAASGVPAAPPPHAPAVPPPPAPPPVEARPSAPDRQAAMRAAIAQLMARSKREVPHYYLAEDVDMTAALAFLERRNLELPVAERLLPAVLLVKAVALALCEVPELNGFWTDGAFRAGSGVHVGFAVSLREGGLVAPAIHDADEMPLEELMQAVRGLVRRTRAGTLRASEMSDPTITVTSLGERGAQAVYGIIYPPQVALVGFGRTCERPWAEGGMVGARPVLTATLSADHRASDGATGGRFLAAVARNLRRPEEL